MIAKFLGNRQLRCNKYIPRVFCADFNNKKSRKVRNSGKKRKNKEPKKYPIL